MLTVSFMALSAHIGMLNFWRAVAHCIST